MSAWRMVGRKIGPPFSTDKKINFLFMRKYRKKKLLCQEKTEDIFHNLLKKEKFFFRFRV